MANELETTDTSKAGFSKGNCFNGEKVAQVSRRIDGYACVGIRPGDISEVFPMPLRVRVFPVGAPDHQA